MSNNPTSCMVDAECGRHGYCDDRQCQNMTLGSPCNYYKDQYLDPSQDLSSYGYTAYYNRTSCPSPYMCDKRLSRCVSRFAKTNRSETCTSDGDCSSFQYCGNDTLASSSTCMFKKLVSESCTDSKECLRNHACYEGECVAPCTADAHCYESHHRCAEITVTKWDNDNRTDFVNTYCIRGKPAGRTGFFVGVILGPILFVAFMILLGLWMRKRRLRRHTAAVAAAKTSQQAPVSPLIVATASTATATGDGSAVASARYDGSELSMRAPSSAATGSRTNYPTVPPSYEYSVPKKNEELSMSK